MSVSPVQRGTATGASGLAGATCTPATPTGVVAGDLLVVWAVSDNAATAAGFSLTSGTGAAWNPVGSGQDNSGFGAGMAWWKFASAAEPANYTVGYDGTNVVAGVVAYQVTTVNNDSPFPSGSSTYSFNATTSGTQTSPSVTGINGGILLTFYGTVGTSNAAQSFTPGVGQTELLDQSAGSTAVASIEICSVALSADGATGTHTSTSATSRRAVTGSMAIAPFVTPTPIPNRARFRATNW